MGDNGDKELRALCKLFIGGIPRDVTSEELAEMFLQYTDDESLNDCIVIRDASTQESRGFGFVTYNKLSDTDNCLANRPHVIKGKEVEVKHAIPRDEQVEANHNRTNKIFVGGFPADTDEQATKDAIEGYTLAVGESLNVGVQKVDIITKDQPRGFCFLEMASEDDADKVVIVKYFNINGKKVELKKAEPKGQKGMSRGRGRGGGRDSSRGGGRMNQSYGGGGGWGGGGQQSYGGGSSGYGNYDQYAGAAGGFGSGYGASGYGQFPIPQMASYGAASYGGGGFNDYSNQLSSFGPSRTSNGRYGGAGSASNRSRGGGYRPY